jgi:hypothetical protein
MTPAQHATEASNLLTQAAAGLAPAVPTSPEHAQLVRLAWVHATLATAAGTGTDYTEAEALLAQAATGVDPGQHRARLIEMAAVHATLASA